MRNNAIAISLAVVIVGLLAVGAATGLVLRHIVQVFPAAMLLVFARKRSWFAYGALPVSIFWLFIMTAIWLWLTAGVRIITGHFSPIEVVLTIVIGAGALAGIVFTLRERPRTDAFVGVAAFVVMLALQVAFMWMSLRPMIARR